MTPELRQAIIDILTVYLNRVPSEKEINNAQTDEYVMGKVRDVEIAINKGEIQAVKTDFKK